ncbi:methylenetetrahydrofolate reductase [Alcanivorax xiamenensis]|uniref:Methylenetetrahydrofolate reductase n=1 Tax=Alcanivorax xiamenensis TaxID=1177156 RepID=A0ABQ6Y9Q9_9GAMM|nr:methylenetetrahydrofolate reductase [Alcanivorax xiamenensis]
MTILKQALDAHRFVCVMEVLPRQSAAHVAALGKILQRGHFAGGLLVPSFADRVGPHSDPGPLQGAEALGCPTSSLLHFSGKDRERSDLLNQLGLMKARGLKQLLLLTGDRLPGHCPGQAPVRYLESVPALQIVRESCPDWLLGAALNPFKYLEEEAEAQYLKARKKQRAGADFFTLQLGYDAARHLEAQQWMHAQPHSTPMLACVMRLTAQRAAALQSVPGIVVTDSMRQMLDSETRLSQDDADTRSLKRLALQILGLQWMGYAGIHLSGVHTLEELLLLEQHLTALRERVSSLDAWHSEWRASWQLPGGPEVCFTPDIDVRALGRPGARATDSEHRRYRRLATVHRLFFQRGSLLSRAFGWLVTRRIWKTTIGGAALHAAERAIKRPLVGCDTCGSCRLQDTVYVCPETCPKGLANGPCGGTYLNRCEFGDRECIHSVKYRLAKSADRLPMLAQTLIPCISADDRHRSSWPQWFEADASKPED